MSGRRSVVEWVETTEEVVASEESTTPDTGTASAVLAVLEHSETPIQKLLDTMVQAQDPEVEDEFYCSECRVLFQVDQGELGGIDGPSFVLDSPTAVGVTQRALLTLPHGLMIGRSSIPTAGLGVINQGPTVSPGMHFGPYEGEATTREGAIQSDFSWEVFKGKGEYEYIDAARETHSNWMRYVNCARSEDENNLLAVQYKDSILFHCCRAIHPGDELMVWPSSKLFSQFSDTWTQIWFLKCTPSGSNATLASQVFTCAHCQLSFTTEAYLQRHTDRFHLAPTEVCATPGMEAVEGEGLPSTTEEETPSAPLLVLTIDPVSSKTCSDCGKIFKHSHHLRRHKLNVHSNKRPYCCPQCRRCFSQTSGLLRHQLMHKKQALEKGTKTLMMLPSIAVEQNAIVMDATDESVSELPELSSRPHEEGETLPEGVHESPKPLQDKADVISVSHEQDNDLNTNLLESSDEPTNKCLLCEKTYRNEIHLKKHQLAVHKNLRPYVCSLCRKSFYQYSDLARHLKLHQKLGGICDVGKTAVDALDSFSCSRCLLSFSSEDSLEQHVCEQDPEENPQGVSVSDQEKCPLPSDDEEKLNPNFIAPPPLTKMVPHLSQRPQRLGARSKLSAITKMIAPKRRQKKTPLSSPAQEVCTETEVPDSHGSMHTDVESAKFSCRCCKGTYSSEVDLKAHKCTMTRHGCAQCKASFKSAGFLKRHEKKAHSGTKTYTCDRCDKTFAKLGNFKQHQKSNKCLKHHCSSELFPCPFCQFSFTMKSYLYKHIKRHHPIEYASYSESHQQTGGHGEEEGGEPHVCPRCGKKYVSEKIFKSHACFKQVRILYLCTDCGKGFTNHYGLKQHQRIHTGEKPYSCPHCGKSFSYMGQVNVHIRTHTGEKPYLCTHCGESFRQSGDLKRHERKHTGVRPHNCPDCFRSFSRPQSLKAHQMLHLGQKMFKCTQCGKSFSRNYHLRRHHQKMHS